MSPLVSVIIPCKDAALWLAEAIQSCLDQTWSAIEVIVVDNGSTDDSVAIAQAFEDPRVVVTHCERAGASAARNVGLTFARGDFVQFLDADDMLHRDKIRLQLDRLARSPRGTVASGAWTTFRNDPAKAVLMPEPVWRDFAPGEFMICSWLGGGMMPVFGWLTPRSVIDKAGRWNEELSLDDDGEFFVRVNLASTGVVFCNGSRGFYRKSERPRLSSRADPDALASGFKATKLSSEALLAACNSPEAVKACAYNFQRFIYYAYPAVPDLVRIAERRVQELGGADWKLGGGPALQVLSACFGWKVAKRCQFAWKRVLASFHSRYPGSVGR